MCIIYDYWLRMEFDDLFFPFQRTINFICSPANRSISSTSRNSLNEAHASLFYTLNQLWVGNFWCGFNWIGSWFTPWKRLHCFKIPKKSQNTKKKIYSKNASNFANCQFVMCFKLAGLDWIKENINIAKNSPAVANFIYECFNLEPAILAIIFSHLFAFIVRIWLTEATNMVIFLSNHKMQNPNVRKATN